MCVYVCSSFFVGWGGEFLKLLLDFIHDKIWEPWKFGNLHTVSKFHQSLEMHTTSCWTLMLWLIVLQFALVACISLVQIFFCRQFLRNCNLFFPVSNTAHCFSLSFQADSCNTLLSLCLKIILSFFHIDSGKHFLLDTFHFTSR